MSLRSRNRIHAANLVFVLLAGGCTAILGLDNEYLLDETGATTEAAGGGGAGASTGSESTTTGSGTSSNSSSTGDVLVEDCMNGIDDDGDAKTDCADEDCGAYTCVPAHMNTNIHVAAPGPGATCDAPLQPIELVGCAGCKCDTSPGTCQVTLENFYNQTCTDEAGDIVSPKLCHDHITDADRWFTATTVHRNNETCASASAQASADRSVACGIVGGGQCSGDQVCVPKAASGPQISCVLVESTGCVSPYTPKGTFYPDDGQQSCDCSCTKGAKGCSDPVITVYSNSDNCTGASTKHTLTLPCQGVGFANSSMVPDATGTLECTLSTSPTEGATKAYTLCCL